jgi:hypothetical protein
VFDHGHTGSEDGTGFGLAIVERIVEAHGWSVAAGGSSSGGARFEIRTGAGRDVGAEPGDGDGDWNGNGNGGEEGCPSVTPGSAASED